MDANVLLLAIAGLSSALLLIRGARSGARGWLAVAVVLAAVAAGGFLAFRSVAGYAAGAAWAALVIVPSLGQALVGRLSNRQRYGAAARLARAIRWLHPADGWWDRPRILEALHLAQRGAVDEATAALEALEASSKQFAREARVHLLRMTSRWEDVLAWLRAVPEPEVAQNPALLLLYLRALGETGHLEELCARFAAAEPALARASGGRNVGRLFVLAFAGRPARVDALFRGPLADYSAPLRAFWSATAELAAGASEPARARLRALLELPDAGLRTSVERRLERPLADPSTLGAAALATLAHLERAQDDEERYGAGPSAIGGRAWATLGLMALLGLVFAVEELAGGSTRVETLSDLGAVWPEYVLAGQWWRVFAATLLHFGALHLGMNLAGLYVLGPYVEYALGRARYLVVYAVAGVGTMVAVVLLYRAGAMPPQLLVGASGSIMGLVGATGAVALRGFRREGSKVAGRRLRWVAFIVGLQVVFDRLIPQVSALSHAGGALLGFATAALMRHRVTPAR